MLYGDVTLNQRSVLGPLGHARDPSVALVQRLSTHCDSVVSYCPCEYTFYAIGHEVELSQLMVR